MKNYLITASIAITALTGGVVVGDVILDETNSVSVTLPDETTTEIELGMEIKDGHLLIKSGIYTYDLGGSYDLQTWAETYDTGDDEKLRLIKKIIVEELKTKTPNELINQL